MTAIQQTLPFYLFFCEPQEKTKSRGMDFQKCQPHVSHVENLSALYFFHAENSGRLSRDLSNHLIEQLCCLILSL